MTNPDLWEEKTRLRRALAAQRDAIAPDEARRAAAAAVPHLVSAVAGSPVVAVYSAIRSELDPRPAAARLLHEGTTLAFPRVNAADGTLQFFRVDDLAALRPGHLGIFEPLPSMPALPLDAIDAFVMPGLGFDARGARLGWGKGFYDRTLLAAPAATRVGFAFASQLVENAPFGPGDAALDCVITESGGVHCGRRAQTE